MGLSMGGYVAMDIQRRHPEAVAVWLCVTPWPPLTVWAARPSDHGERRADQFRGPVMHFTRPAGAIPPCTPRSSRP
ncbi:MAG: hypothetical protein ACLS6O_03685 [Bifidobacterium sp.]